MAINSLKARLQKGKLKTKSLYIVYKSVWNHPFLVLLLLLLLCLRRSFPWLFYILVSNSPILVCTAVLLATFLIHGQPNDYKVRETSDVHASKTEQHVEKEGYLKGRFAEVRKDLVEKGMKAYLAELEDKEAQMRKFQAKSIDKMARAYNDHGGRLDYSSLDPQKHVDYGTDHGSTDVESDEAEGSFLEAVPTPQETRPLLDTRDHAPHPHSASPKSEEDGSEDVDDDDDEEEEEEEEQDNTLDVEKDTEKPVTMWTEEDEKNLRYLGTCELERNQCLENLIARRKHQRTFSAISDRTFAAFERSDVPTFQVTPVTRPHSANPFDVPDNMNPPSAPLPRKNPFDSPSTSPKSRQPNPFDVPNNPQDIARKESVLRRYESFSPEYGFMGDGSDSRQEFMPIDKRDGLLLRHESFTTRSTFPNLFSLEKPTEGFQMKPVFAPTKEAQQASSVDRQSSHDSESMISSGSDTESSVAPSNHEPEVTSKQHQDEEAIKMANQSPQNDHDEHQKAQICDHVKEGKEGEHNQPTSTSQVEGEVHELNSLPENSTEESDANNTTNDEDQVPKEPVYDTSPSCVEKGKDFSLASET